MSTTHDSLHPGRNGQGPLGRISAGLDRVRGLHTGGSRSGDGRPGCICAASPWDDSSAAPAPSHREVRPSMSCMNGNSTPRAASGVDAKGRRTSPQIPSRSLPPAFGMRNRKPPGHPWVQPSWARIGLQGGCSHPALCRACARWPVRCRAGDQRSYSPSCASAAAASRATSLGGRVSP